MKRAFVSTEIPIDYFIRTNNESQGTFLLLHGYSQTASFMWEKFEKILPSTANVIAPQGIYPLPKQFPLSSRKPNEDLFSGYGWYFFDPVTGKFPIDYRTPTLAISALLKQLNLHETNITIIAYSQGSYLSLFCAEEIPSISKILGINGAWRWDKLHRDLKIEIHSLNGENDVVVDPNKARDGHEKLLQHGCSGSFHLIKNEGHKLTPPFIDKILLLI
ncbi:MAG: hypothetical protein Fur0010_01890 [Bdellovibrio sp.]